jgi:hypothetical protein
MPKVVITKRTIPIILRELDKWKGKLTWDLFSQRVAEVLGEEGVSRHTLIKYKPIKDAFDERKRGLRDASNNRQIDDVNIEMLLNENSALTAKIKRLEKQEAIYKEQFVRWLENIRKMPGVDLTKLNTRLDTPLAKVDRR